MLAAAAQAEGTGILCLILLIATVITLIVGIAQALGLFAIRVSGGRYNTLILGVVLLVVYVILC